MVEISESQRLKRGCQTLQLPFSAYLDALMYYRFVCLH
jgi:hypothetical protein